MTAFENNDASRIHDEVEKRKNRAKELGIFELFDGLYYDKIRNYPKWIKRQSYREQVCSLISDAIQLDKETTQITLNGKVYLFNFHEKAGARSHGTMTLSINGKKALAITMSFEGKVHPQTLGFNGEWKSSGIEAFVEGDWISDFKRLKERIAFEDAERANIEKKEEEVEKLKKLKNDFGIE